MKFISWLKKKLKHSQLYVLTDDEKRLWCQIEKKASEGYSEWYNQTKGDDICGPWIKNVTPSEIKLINKIHEKYYGKDWTVFISVSEQQVNYIKYTNIKKSYS